MAGFFALYPAIPGECLGIVIADDEHGARDAFDAVGLFEGSGGSDADHYLRVVAVEPVTRARQDELAMELGRAVGGAVVGDGAGDGVLALLDELGRWGLVQREGHACAVYRPATVSLESLRLIMDAGLERAHHDAERQRAATAYRAGIARELAAIGRTGLFPWGA